ncbi:MAG TPA: hypothetical protein VF665_16970 [Longimicrobium sp.]|jgi:hypothetical protein|uniref:hypothetical protein n=1 Tax=Longimicrobium sp. TaxID=2029185 RepID=UPI002EDB177D
MTARSATPLADSALRNPVGIPPGLDRMLRTVEQGARRLRSRLAPLAERDDALPSLRAAAEEARLFLEDELRSPLHRALRRPLRQIAPGTPGASVLQQAFEGMRARAERAAELQEAVAVLRAGVRRLNDRHAPVLPRATRVALAAARVGEEDVARLRRAADVQPLQRRLAEAGRELDRLAAHLPAGTAFRRGAAWDEEVAPEELVACMELRLRERGRVAQERAGAGPARPVTVRLVRELAAAAATPRAPSDPQLCAQEAARMLVAGEADARGGEDLALWDGLVGWASGAVYAPAQASAWAPVLPAPGVQPDGDAGATRFVVPIDESYALITPHLRSGVRVRDRRVVLDATVDCAAFSPPDEAETLGLAALDIAPLFDGLDAQPRWYSTQRNTQLLVVAETERGFLARVTRRGTLQRSRTPAWNPEPGERARLRVLGSLGDSVRPDVIDVGPGDGSARTFAGLQTTPVDLPFIDAPTAWLRSAVPAHARNAVDEEAHFFRTVALRVPYTVPRWIGRGRCASRSLQGALYVKPFGLRAADSPPLQRWLAARNSVALLAAAARLWLRLHDAGCALGVYHVDHLVFRPDWSTPGERPRLLAVVAEAPFGTQLGRPHRRPPPDAGYVPLYAGLGVRVLPPGVAAGQAASPETEARAFALFALDALAHAPLPLSNPFAAEDLSAAVPGYAQHFTQPDLAASLGAALSSPDAPGLVIEWIRALAASRG